MTTTLTDQVLDALRKADWTPVWSGSTTMGDEYGNVVTICRSGEDEFKVEFTYALNKLVETLYLDPASGAHRITKIILAAADLPED